jgi:hypothetical protein
MRGIRLSFLVAAAASSLLAMSSARAGVLYSSGGFESPTFSTSFVNPFDPTVAGNLRGQDAVNNVWREATANPTDGQGALTGTGVVETKASGAGADLQDAKLTRTQYDNRWSPTFVYTQNGTNPVVNIDWSMKVTQTLTNLSKFGPFFGIEAYDASGGPPLRIGGLGVDATTGELLFEDPVAGGLNITPLDATVAFDQYNDFNISLNYSTHQYSIALNGAVLVGGINFYTAGVTGLTDADISALQAAPSGQDNPTGVAYFDNYRVTSAPLPEPASLGLLSFAALAMKRRR